MIYKGICSCRKWSISETVRNAQIKLMNMIYNKNFLILPTIDKKMGAITFSSQLYAILQKTPDTERFYKKFYVKVKCNI